MKQNTEEIAVSILNVKDGYKKKLLTSTQALEYKNTKFVSIGKDIWVYHRKSNTLIKIKRESQEVRL